MPYVENQIVHDADSHLMELPDCLDDYFDSKLLAAFEAIPRLREKQGKGDWALQARKTFDDPQFRAGEAENILLRKNYEALGGFLPGDRPKALDLLGFASQIVFTTFCLGNFTLDEGSDMDLCYGAARAHNRMMTDFCSVDRRLLPTGYVPLADLARAPKEARLAIELGCKALMIPSRCPPGHSQSHIALDPVWAQAQEAGIPIVFHVGGQRPIDPSFMQNGLPAVPDFHGGEENFTSVSFMAIPESVQQALATMIFDGVLDRFPRLKFGVIELGASWLPGWMRFMDAAHGAFFKNEERLHKLSMRPSEFVKRQVRVTPYPHEDAGWIIANSDERICMFSSDYPHVEGGRNPLKRFSDSIAGTSKNGVDGFFRENFIDLMGEGLAADLRRPAHLIAA